MLNHMIAWHGWIFPAAAKGAEPAGPTKSELATFERMVLKVPHLKLVTLAHTAETPDRKLH